MRSSGEVLRPSPVRMPGVYPLSSENSFKYRLKLLFVKLCVYFKSFTFGGGSGTQRSRGSLAMVASGLESQVTTLLPVFESSCWGPIL
jgi:hypothetical protein